MEHSAARAASFNQGGNMLDRTLIYVGEDEASAVELLTKLRNRDIGGALRSAYFFDGCEPCGKVTIMEDVPNFLAAKIREAYEAHADVMIDRREWEEPAYTPLPIPAPRTLAAIIDTVKPIQPAKRGPGRPRKVRA
jgi:hypothetical protein